MYRMPKGLTYSGTYSANSWNLRINMLNRGKREWCLWLCFLWSFIYFFGTTYLQQIGETWLYKYEPLFFCLGVIYVVPYVLILISEYVNLNIRVKTVVSDRINICHLLKLRMSISMLLVHCLVFEHLYRILSLFLPFLSSCWIWQMYWPLCCEKGN